MTDQSGRVQSPEKGPYAYTYPSKRSMEAFPVACPVCDEPPGYPCRTGWMRRRAHYQHVARRRLRGLLRQAEKGSSSVSAPARSPSS